VFQDAKDITQVIHNCSKIASNLKIEAFSYYKDVCGAKPTKKLRFENKQKIICFPKSMLNVLYITVVQL